MSPYNILSDIKSGRIQVKSMDSATILFFKCQRWDYTRVCEECKDKYLLLFYCGYFMLELLLYTHSCALCHILVSVCIYCVGALAGA